MQVIKDVNTNTIKLLITKDKWDRLKKISTQKDDERAALEEMNRLNDEKKIKHKELIKTLYDYYEGRELKDNKKKLDDIENQHLKRDEERRFETMERRKKIIEKMYSAKRSAKDSSKLLGRKIQIVEVYKERDLQMQFNKAEKVSNLEKTRLEHQEQNLNAECYKRERWEEKLQEASNKKDKSAILIKELKEREDQRHEANIKLKEDGKRELERIIKEIEKEKQEENIKNQAIKETILKNIAENRKIVEQKNKERQYVEQMEDAIIDIIAKSKNKTSRMIKMKENEMFKEKQMSVQLCMENAAKIVLENSIETDANNSLKKAIEEQEAQYQKEQFRKDELAKKMKKDIEDSIKASDEKILQEQKRLELSRQWEQKRQQRESNVLRELETLERQAKINKMKDFRKDLDIQCNNNRIAKMADKQIMVKHTDELIKLSHKEDEEFITYTKSLIDKYEKAGISVKPLFQAIKDYGKQKNCS